MRFRSVMVFMGSSGSTMTGGCIEDVAGGEGDGQDGHLGLVEADVEDEDVGLHVVHESERLLGVAGDDHVVVVGNRAPHHGEREGVAVDHHDGGTRPERGDPSQRARLDDVPVSGRVIRDSVGQAVHRCGSSWSGSGTCVAPSVVAE